MVPARTPAGTFFVAGGGCFLTAATQAPARVRTRGRARITPLPPQWPSAWAVAFGEDRHGLWQAFAVAGVRQVMRWIPPGHFVMGSPELEPGRERDETEHGVTLTAGFWLADTACTQALWAAVMKGANPSRFNEEAENPVEQVSWDDIVTGFLPRLNACVDGLSMVLPTEAQWEYACRADAQARTPFWFGGQITSERVNFNGNYPMPGGAKSDYREGTVPVKALPCNGWGLYQMHGNVLEWCADGYAEYPAGDVDDPRGPAQPPDGAAGRVLRGGSWFFLAQSCRSALRFDLDPGGRLGDVGFRLARGPS